MELLKFPFIYNIKTPAITAGVFYFYYMKDFLIIGGGLAGVCFAETCRIQNKTYTIVNDSSQNSTRVAAGIYNPVILKRFSLPADSAKHIFYSNTFYQTIEERLQQTFINKLPVLRKFVSAEEQNNWFEAADKPALQPFLDTDIIRTNYPAITSPFGYGRVHDTGYMDTIRFLDFYHKELLADHLYINDTFDYSILEIFDNHVAYKDYKSKYIVFAEGFGIQNNPFFSYLPLDGTKGELIIIESNNLQLDAILNAGIFILPIGMNRYKVGATYEWYDKTDIPTEAGKTELIDKLENVIDCDYTIIDHQAGIRPTVKDRKPLIGTHPKYSNLHLLNGLGTRGVTLGPYMAKELMNAIITGIPPEKSINLSRFKH